jgi:hypothetical protein
MFHKNSCPCCNDYVAHTIHACKEQGVNLPIQAVGDAVTKAWPMLMQDVEDDARERALDTYKDLADDAASPKAELKASKAALTSEHSRVERWDKTIHDLKDEITALRRPQSTASTVTSSVQSIAHSSRAAGHSSHPTGPLAARARSSLAAWMTKPGLASRMEMPPKTDRYSDLSGSLADTCPPQTGRCPMVGNQTQTGNPKCPSGMR